MLTYKTFRWKVHSNTHHDIDNVLNVLPANTAVEGYVCTGDEILVTVSHYEPYAREIGREAAKMAV